LILDFRFAIGNYAGSRATSSIRNPQSAIQN
jgi:hypothetical protein